MDSDTRQAIFELLSDRIVMLVSTGAPADLLSQASLVVVLDESTISGIGDAQWFKRVARDHLPGGQDAVVAGVAGGGLPTDEEELIDDL